MSANRSLLLVGLLCLLGGCFDVSDEVWWNADGSARLRRTIKLVATAETAKARADAILERGLYEGIEFRKDPRVKTFDVKTSVEDAFVVAVEDLEVKDAKDLVAVQRMISAKVVVDGATFEWFPALTFERLPSGNVKFFASIADLKLAQNLDAEQAKARFGERSWSLKLYGPAITSASPATAAIGEGQVEWRTALADIASGHTKEADFLAEIAPTAAVSGGLVAGVVVLLLAAIVLAVRWRRQAAHEAAMKPVRPPAPRTMPTASESGAIPIPVVASEEALLSDASEINVDADEDVPTVPVVAAQASADAVIKFKCPKCAVELKIPLSLAGRQGKCRKCGGAFVSPIPGQLKQVRAAVAAAPQTQQTPATLRDAFSVKKVKCECGMTSAVLKGREAGTEKCPACDKVLVTT
ncbi:MAG: hypothetical protein ACAI25_03330 [Planctomycetota bacterium]